MELEKANTMIVSYNFGTREYKIDLSKGRDISIPIDFNIVGPNCFYAPPPSVFPVQEGDFIGDTSKGGVVNFKNIKLNPHGNGTHTECVGHIATEPVFIHDVLTNFHFLGQILSIYPTINEAGDRVITKRTIEQFFDQPTSVLIIRTLPNEESKKNRNYSGTNPPYFEADALTYIREMGVQHLMTDLPSVDREQDEGKLAGHKAWWQYPEKVDYEKTITEMVFVPDDLKDGFYFVNIQIMSIKLDASPSKILLYPLD